MKTQKQAFQYNYYASEQNEIRSIRAKYLPKEESSKMDQLRKLDRSATRKATVTAWVIGLISTLLAGIGILSILFSTGVWMIVGFMICPLGVIGVFASYPLYVYITKKQREKLSPKILQLVDELKK